MRPRKLSDFFDRFGLAFVAAPLLLVLFSDDAPAWLLGLVPIGVIFLFLGEVLRKRKK